MARYGHDGKDGESDSIHESKAKKRNTLEDHQAMMKQSVAFLNGIADIDALYQKREARDGKGAARGPWATRNRVGAGMGSWTQHT